MVQPEDADRWPLRPVRLNQLRLVAPRPLAFVVPATIQNLLDSREIDDATGQRLNVDLVIVGRPVGDDRQPGQVQHSTPLRILHPRQGIEPQSRHRGLVHRALRLD
jgi:hypothetical protein